ncbi:MAG: MMPL family transporter [Luteolibacter sp.]
MLRRFAVPALLVLAILTATFGLIRLKFDTDILSMLPAELPEVKGLKAFHSAFSRQDELVVLIRGTDEDAGTLPDAAVSLAEKLRDSGAVKSARWKPLWTEEPAGMAELIAYLWLNGDPEAVRAQVERLSPGRSEETLRDAHAKVGTSMEGVDMVMQAHDPLGFLAHPAITHLLEQQAGDGGGNFESPDGTAQILLVEAAQPLHGYREAEAWLKKIREIVRDWLQEDENRSLRVNFTGEPVFSSEIGTAMESDLSGSISITLGLIGILFWWMQRRFSLLLGLIGVLVIIFAVALGVAGWMYGELSIMALSSIEILIGLSVDYGLVICQEAKVAGHDEKELRHASSRPVMCGALVTAVVFLALNLGGLPGMAQLGSIVAYGLLTAAILMLLVYLPFVAKFGVNRAPATGSGKQLPRRKASWWITGSLALAAIAVLCLNGLPGAVFDSKIMRPKNSEAMATFETLQNAFPAWSNSTIGLVIEAGSDAEMLEKIPEAQRRIDLAASQGLIQPTRLATGWWPDAATQTMNRPPLAGLLAQRERLLVEADRAGFSGEGLVLGRAVMNALEARISETSTAFPSSGSAREMMRLFLNRQENGGGVLLGSLQPRSGIDPAGKDYDGFRAMAGDGIWLSGWSLFQPAISRLVKTDMTRMLVPMFALLLGMMWVIFRKVGDVGLALFAMALSTLLLLAIMSLCGLTWNFVNLMATPLLLGTGIDYAIHVTLSLRRTRGNFRDLWNGTGKALLFCGASNVIGFGSLIYSSSEALVSLGIVAVIGITLSMATSIFLLPGWRTARES